MESQGRGLSAPCAVVDCAAFRENLAAVRSYVGPDVRIMAVIKANGYGHGMVALAREAGAYGIADFGVARVSEGLELRAAGFSQRILVFESAAPGSLNEAIAHELTLTITDPAGLECIEQEARVAGKRAAVHVKTDTGMGRLGLPAEQAHVLVIRAARSAHLRLDGVYSHFATSEDPDRSYALQQLERFHVFLENVSRAGVDVPLRHMANSGAIIAIPEAYFDMVRPGIMLYGYPPGQGMPERNPVRPVLSLVSRVAFMKDVAAGTSVSYGRRFSAKAPTRIVTVPMGYGDGYSRLLTGKAEALIRGRRFPVVGTICMDQLMIDVGGATDVAVGDEVVFIGRRGGEQITGWDVAAHTGTIPYETTCAITPRVPRVYEGCR
jgi:alanine racemase